MPDIPMVAFKTTDPAVIAAWKTTAERVREASKRAVEGAEKIGKNRGLMIERGLTDETFVGLAPLNPSDPPDGWRYVREQFEPRRGKAGDQAREWLASVQRPSMRRVMAEHGLPEVTTFRYGFMGRPGIVMHDDTVFAIYKGGPDGEVGSSWEPCRPSKFYAAQENADVTAAVA